MLSFLAWSLLPAVASSAPAETPGMADAPFAQELRIPVPPLRVKGDAGATAIAVESTGRIWAGNSQGLAYLDGHAWNEPVGSAVEGPVYDLLIDPAGGVLVASLSGVYRAQGDTLTRLDGLDEPIVALARAGEQLMAAGPGGYWCHDGAQWRPVAIAASTNVRAMLSTDDAIWIGASIGLYQHASSETRRWFAADALQSCQVSALAMGRDGTLYVGSNRGIDLFRQGRREASLTPAEGLPCSQVTALAVDAEDRLWVGTTLGVARWARKNWSLRHGPRWLPSDEVADLAIAPDGTAWIATSGGVAALGSQSMTLAEKAEHYEDLIRLRHVRPPGLVESCRLTTPGDVSTATAMDTDNDGMYTGMYLAAEAYRFAATGDLLAKQHAQEAYEALEFLHTVTETEGFIARTVVPPEWTSMADANRSHTARDVAEGRVDDARFKRVDQRWRLGGDGRWRWKGDTSSDEVTGHFYAYAVFHDLAADAPQKARVVAHVRKLTDSLIEGGYVLRDLDGNATRWGVWSPERINHDPNWAPERGINSVELISFLTVAAHLTGDTKYDERIEQLLHEAGFAENMLTPQPTDPGQFTYIDGQLLAMCYRNLFAYEQNAARRHLYRRSLQAWFTANRSARSPYYGFTYGAIEGEDFDLPELVAYLRDMPLDAVQWTVDNRAREDIKLVRKPYAESWQTDRLLPPSETAIIRWDANRFAALAGQGGHTESTMVHWLLPYWMGRYHGWIGPPSDP